MLRNILLIAPGIVLVGTLFFGCGMAAQNAAAKGVFSGQAMRLIHASGKSFKMGDSAYASTKPVHKVKFAHDFYMDTTEVTQADYQALMGVNPSYFTGDPQRPVERVTWYDAILYCNARSKRDRFDTVYQYTMAYGDPGDGCPALVNLDIDYKKNGYRLPTEAEWEYACRGGKPAGYEGDNISRRSNYAWWKENSGNSTHPVATKLPNAFGLYDMGGNVWEWCNDGYMSGSYTRKPQIDPTGPSSNIYRVYRVLRGGSWQSGAGIHFCSYRYGNFPDGRFRYGFRCVKRR
jgi:sulfatase modifying factor 1